MILKLIMDNDPDDLLAGLVKVNRELRSIFIEILNKSCLFDICPGLQ